MVFLVDYAISVEVLPANASQSGTILRGVVVYLILALEDTVIDVAHLCSERMSHHTLHAIAAESALGSDGFWQFGHLVAVGADVAGDVILECTNLAAIASIELYTLVFHLTSIDPLAGSFAHHADARHVDQDVFCLFEVPFERAIQTVVEEAEVKTDVGLRGGFPLQVVIAKLVALETTGQRLSTIGAGDVVAGAITLATKLRLTIIAHKEGVSCQIGDFLVTCLSP